MPNTGIAPPNFATTTGQFRALLGDTDAINIISGSGDDIGEYVWFSDDEIGAFLALYADNPKRAAARALLTIAGSQALLLKKWSADDLSVDGAAIAEALRKQAKDLQDEADAGDNSIDIFELSYPGSAVTYVPELFPAEYGRIVGTSPFSPEGGEWVIDGDGYIVNG